VWRFCVFLCGFDACLINLNFSQSDPRERRTHTNPIHNNVWYLREESPTCINISSTHANPRILHTPSPAALLEPSSGRHFDSTCGGVNRHFRCAGAHGTRHGHGRSGRFSSSVSFRGRRFVWGSFLSLHPNLAIIHRKHRDQSQPIK